MCGIRALDEALPARRLSAKTLLKQDSEKIADRRRIYFFGLEKALAPLAIAMRIETEPVKFNIQPRQVAAKRTRHGPMTYSDFLANSKSPNTQKNRNRQNPEARCLAGLEDTVEVPADFMS
jgi:hypothetical protein